jgi:hypothetical protein
MLDQGVRHNGNPVLVPLAGMHDDLPVVEIHVLDTQAQIFHFPHTGATEHVCDQSVDAVHEPQEPGIKASLYINMT